MIVSEYEFHGIVVWILIIGFIGVAWFLLGVEGVPYGRYGGNGNVVKTRSGGTISIFGNCGIPDIPARWAWMIQESPTLIWSVLCIYSSRHSDFQLNSANVILLCMFTVHYVNRSLIFPWRCTPSKPTPFSVFVSAFAFCFINGYLQCRYLTHFNSYSQDWIYSLQFFIGCVIFCTGSVINLMSDEILLNLRKTRNKKEYKIPKGFLFEYVSCPNYLGEIIEWTGFFIASGSLCSFAFALCTICNLGPRALHHHQWYKNKFDQRYPSQRKALIPYLL